MVLKRSNEPGPAADQPLPGRQEVPPPAILLRESYRDNGKVKTRTLANITHLGAAKIEALRRALAGSVRAGPRG